MKTSFILLLAAAFLVRAQDLDRTFPLGTAAQQGVREIATVIRAIADIKQLDTGQDGRSIAIHGNSDQIGLTEWLLKNLDAPAGYRQLRAAQAPNAAGQR